MPSQGSIAVVHHADLQSDSPHLPDGFPFHPALLLARCRDCTQGDTYLPAQSLYWRNRQHLGVVVRQREVLGEVLNLRVVFLLL